MLTTVNFNNNNTNINKSVLSSDKHSFDNTIKYMSEYIKCVFVNYKRELISFIPIVIMKLLNYSKYLILLILVEAESIYSVFANNLSTDEFTMVVKRLS